MKNLISLLKKVGVFKAIGISALIGFILVIIFLVLLPKNSNSQEISSPEKWKINSINFVAGETPLTKGITLSPVFSKGKSTIMIDLNQELGELMFFYSPKKWCSIGPSVGFFKNTSWVGPIASLNIFNGHVTTLNWVGWSFGNPEAIGGGTTNSNVDFLFSFHQVSVNYFGVEGYYILQHYQKNFPGHIVGVKYTFALGDNFSLFGGYAYMFRADKSLWSAGFILLFPEK
ncbi:MAG: hypothetical protein WC812_03910 [Candidatus Pacearchaeota archaeon]|jgi:hypothetical protein